ncbi:MAG TPA: M50 family metallopeptidase [Solirubrobacteraceae bacterium]|nr:M50 family metallopeptidase [Solirubrobacteraceae bacterium]
MFGERSIQLFRVGGIRVGASPSWFLILFFAIWILSGSFRDTLGGSSEEAYVVAVLAAVLFFGSIIVHELGHAIAARRSGFKVERIELWLFGGLTTMDRESRTPGEEFRVTAAGPAATLLIFLACFAATFAIEGDADRAVDIVTLAAGATGSPAELLLGFVASMNAVLFIFNLIPAFPLDGGRIARAAVWKLTGDRTKGTVAAARLGQGFGWLLMAYGAYALFFTDDYGGLWSIVLGWLIAGSAKSAIVSARVNDRLEGVTVGDIMDPQPLTLPASTRLIDAEDWFAQHDAEWAAVVDDEGRLLGLAERARISAAVSSGQPALAAHEVLSPGDPVSTDQPLEAVVGAEPLRRLGAVMAVDQSGILRGVLTVEQVRRALTAALP